MVVILGGWRGVVMRLLLNNPPKLQICWLSFLSFYLLNIFFSFSTTMSFLYRLAKEASILLFFLFRQFSSSGTCLNFSSNGLFLACSFLPSTAFWLHCRAFTQFFLLKSLIFSCQAPLPLLMSWFLGGGPNLYLDGLLSFHKITVCVLGEFWPRFMRLHWVSVQTSSGEVTAHAVNMSWRMF